MKSIHASGRRLNASTTGTLSSASPLGIIWIPIKLLALIVIGFWIAIQLFDEFAPIITHTAQRSGGIAYLAHIGGFLFGMLLSRWFRRTAGMEHSYL
jgi:membrane associated rhomboid family serine protease